MTERKSSVAIICELIVHYIQGLSSNPNKGKKQEPQICGHIKYTLPLYKFYAPISLPFCVRKMKEFTMWNIGFLTKPLGQRLKSETPIFNFDQSLFQILQHSETFGSYFSIRYFCQEEFLLLRKQLDVQCSHMKTWQQQVLQSTLLPYQGREEHSVEIVQNNQK